MGHKTATSAATAQTRRESHEQVKEKAASVRDLILEVLEEIGEGTAYEVMAALQPRRPGTEIRAVSGRMTELAAEGRIVPALDEDGQPKRKLGNYGKMNTVFTVYHPDTQATKPASPAQFDVTQSQQLAMF